MNRHLQNIQDFIQQTEHLSADEKAALLKSVKDADSAFAISEFKLERTEKVKRTTAILLEETIEELEQKRKAVEQQNRELEIESALERVRARTMAMQKSDELTDVAALLFKEGNNLGIKTWTAGFNVWSEDNNSYVDYITSPQGGFIKPYLVDATQAEVLKELSDARKSGVEFFVQYVEGERLKETYLALSKFGDEKQYEKMLEDGFQFPSHQYDHFVFGSRVSLMFITYEPVPEAHEVFKRFGKVFEQTYTRFLDLQKAEAQARESQIQLALERVRARTMAMQHSNELKDAAALLFQQAKTLGVPAYSCGYNIWEKNENTFTSWMSTQDGSLINGVPDIPLTEDANFIRYTRSKEKGEEFFVLELRGERMQEHYEYLKTIPAFKGYFDYTISVGFNLPETQIHHVANFLHGNLLFITLEPCPEFHEVFKRFAKVFEQTYTRFLDLQKSEEQAKEAQIEAALERVRSRTMGMQKSDELKEVIQVVYDQFGHLNIHVEHTGFVMDYKARDDYDIWISDHLSVPSHITIPYFDCVYYNRFNEAKRKGEDFFASNLDFEEKNRFYQKIIEYIPGLPEETKEFLFSFPGLAGSTVLLDNVCLYIENFEGIPYTDEENDTLMRFGKVFQQTYTRFLDLQKAEAQAREAQIEAALERTRTQSMLMQHSNELDITSRVFHEQLLLLGIETELSFVWLPDVEKEKHLFWTSWTETENNSTISKSKSVVYDLDKTEPYTAECFRAWESGEPVHVYTVPAAEVKTYLTIWNELISSASNMKPEFFQEGLYYAEAFMKYGCFGIMVKRLLKEDEKKILLRFTVEFERTYTRFLDLQKAEEQAAETKIELSLERVRAKTMAMHNSADVAETVALMFDELLHLGISKNARCGIGILDPNDLKMAVWTAYAKTNENVGLIVGELDMNTHIMLQQVYSSWKSRETHSTYTLTGEDGKNYYRAINQMHNYDAKFDIETLPIVQYQNAFYFKEGIIYFFSLEQISSKTAEILKRFTKVFGQTYTRYLDLLKAEAQARESQIETALERVRSRTLAMHKSDELAETSAVLFQQLIQLGIEPNRLYINIIKDEAANAEFWITDEDGSKVSAAFETNMNDNSTFKKMYKGWSEKKKSLVIDMEGKELQEYFAYLSSIHVPFKDGLSQTRRVQQLAYFNNGFIGIASPDEQSEETIKLLERFAAVFNLTYTRFHDLQFAESQTHKANIEVALERVRARALAMQQPEELVEVAEVMRHEMGLLGVEELETSSIYINKEKSGEAECWYSLKGVNGTEKNKVADHFDLNYNETWVGKQMFKFYEADNKETSIIMQGENRKEWINYCAKQSPVFKGYYGEVIPDRTYHLCKFSNGAIGAATPGEISDESWELLRRAASVFSLAYSRFKDLTKARIDLQQLKEEKQRAETALTDLRATQTQLIQAEKMASLGELTAGIAHEIQNPLNFVNNFSEVSNELIVEMNAELVKGDIEEAKVIANDILQNLAKINHHGKRAADIVKGMLQHSRSSSATKESSDINKLVDEYLRLAYHGLRAKDKTFNAVLKTDFDKTVGNINIIPQDIGRVILNLITNAFYVVNEKKLQQAVDYEPTVSVSTNKLSDKLEIRVKDNGNGIPGKVFDKIFQPFFTTKPTGQGTGLGLSLAYDIVKAHGGALNVETNEGKGTEFIVQLPVV